jgi:flagellar protein FliS
MTTEDQIAKQYKKLQIESASPGRLIVLLYDAAVDFLKKAVEVYEQKPDDWIEQFHNSLIGAQNIITELLVALDMEQGGEVAQNLFKLYEYMNHELVEANMQKKVEPVNAVIELLETLRVAWVEVQDAVQPAAEGPLPSSSGLNIKG